MYITPGMTGYFNFQAENTPGITWALEVSFDITGTINMSNTTGGTLFTSTFNHGVWFEIEFNIDLSKNSTLFLIAWFLILLFCKVRFLFKLYSEELICSFFLKNNVGIS